MATAAATVDRKKSVFRQALTALRYAVAAAVTVVVVMTAVYAFQVIARTDDLDIGIVDSYISVDQNRSDPKVTFALSADNPSGRVRFYYTGIRCELKVNDSRKDPSTAKFDFPDMVVAPDSLLQIGTEANVSSANKIIVDFKKNSSSIFSANLTVTGNLTVGVYSAYNKTSVRTTYYCTSITVGNVSSSSSDKWSANCLKNEGIMEPHAPVAEVPLISTIPIKNN